VQKVLSYLALVYSLIFIARGFGQGFGRKVGRTSVISQQNVGVDYLYLLSAGAIKSPIFGPKTPKSPINKGRD
jgi:hypothetical protein